MTRALSALLKASHLLATADLPASVAAHARMMGVRETVLYLADYEQVTLVPLPGAGVPARRELAIEGTMAGWAFRRVEVVTSRATTATHRMWVPLLDGVERLGVAELVLAAAPAEELDQDLRNFVTLVAQLVVTHDAYSDVFSRLRRRKTLSLAAEMQWELLPARSRIQPSYGLAGQLEPSYSVRGDSFDWAEHEGKLFLSVLNGMGEGVSAALLTALATHALRNARRAGIGLADQAVPQQQHPR